VKIHFSLLRTQPPASSRRSQTSLIPKEIFQIPVNCPQVPRASIIIPAFNESGSIKYVIDGFAAIAGDYEIIVINDASTDGTGEILNSMSGLTVIHHNENLGYGASLMTGIREAHSEIIVTFDADGQHDHNDVLRLLEKIEDCAMVVGARTGGSDFDSRRAVGRRILSSIANFWTGSKIPDINSGLRAFRRNEVLRYEAVLPSGFSFTTTLTLATLKEKRLVRFVPIVTRKRVGRSTFRRLGHGLIVLRGVLRLMVLFHFSGRLSQKPNTAGSALPRGNNAGPIR
jgi:glycosyltransferase involved in cell wall biosynthesis